MDKQRPFNNEQDIHYLQGFSVLQTFIEFSAPYHINLTLTWPSKTRREDIES